MFRSKKKRPDIDQALREQRVIFADGLAKLNNYQRHCFRADRIGEIQKLHEVVEKTPSKSQEREAAQQNLDKFNLFHANCELAEAQYEVNISQNSVDFPPYESVAIKGIFLVGLLAYGLGPAWAVVGAIGWIFLGLAEINRHRINALSDMEAAKKAFEEHKAHYEQLCIASRRTDDEHFDKALAAFRRFANAPLP